MEQCPYVSVIVPFYNDKKYLKRCVDSILHQTLKNIEIILVDDASTDSSWQLVHILYAGIRKVRFIRHEANQGTSASRNTGLHAARGEYVAFIDHDDYIDPQYLEVLYHLAGTCRADIVACGIRKVHADGSAELYSSKELEVSGGIPALLAAADFQIALATWGKIISRKLIVGHDLEYPYGGMEDVQFNFKTLYYANKYICIKNMLYNWCVVDDSLSHDGLAKNYNYIQTFCDILGNMDSFIKMVKSEAKLQWQEVDKIYRFFLKVSMYTLFPLLENMNEDGIQDELQKRLESTFGNHAVYIKSFMLLYYKVYKENMSYRAQIREKDEIISEYAKKLRHC